MIDEHPCCQGPACNQTLVVIPGHRRRQYCSDTCKMGAHRARIARENQARYEALQLELAHREREELRQRWGDLPPEAFDLLRSLRMTYGIVLADQVAGVLQVVRDEARRSLAEERASLIDQVMLAGEQLDFPEIVTEAFEVASGVLAWNAFCVASGSGRMARKEARYPERYLNPLVYQNHVKMVPVVLPWTNCPSSYGTPQSEKLP